MNWPFELPPMPPARHMDSDANIKLPDGTVTMDTTSDHRLFEPVEMKMWADACIAAALRWAAEQCELDAWEPCDCGCPGKKRPQSPQAVGQIRAAHRILAALPKK